MRSVGEIADHCLGKMLDKAKNRGELRPYLRNINVRWFEFDLSDLQEMRFEESEFERYSARKGDLIICEGGYPGRAAIWQSEIPIFLQKALHRVRFHEGSRAKWFLYYLYLSNLNGTLKDYFTGAGIQHFTGETLRKFKFPVPPIEEQDALIATLDTTLSEISRLQKTFEQQIVLLSDLTTSLLGKAFEGDLSIAPDSLLEAALA